VCFVIGAATSGLFLSRAIAQGKPTRPRFEYLCEPINQPWKPDGQQKLNALGAQGWELVQELPSASFCFKRQLP
jgi:hypothetical protein